MHREKYWRSKIPLALLFLLNIFLIMTVELLAFYPHPSKLNTAMLENYDPACADCTILSSDTSGYLESYLAQASDGSVHLIVIKSHPVFLKRAKMLHAAPVTVDDSGEQPVYVKNGIHTSEIVITGGNTVTIRYGYDGTLQEMTTLYLVLGAALEGLELLIWHLIRHGIN